MPLVTAPVSKTMLWTGRIAGAIPVLMLLFSGVMKLMRPEAVLKEFGRLGYSENAALGLGILELACMLVYVIPRTSVLGAILVTGYLGGAVATHVRIGDPLFNIIIPALLGALAWLALYLRDKRLRELLPLRG